MRILLQRVSRASVQVSTETVGSIERGYLILLGVMKGDTDEQALSLAEKVVKLRLFSGEDGKVNDRSILDIKGDILVVSQFTLAGTFEKGNRPDYTAAAPPAEANRLYEFFIAQLKVQGVARVESGEFGASMHVDLVNDGPVTLMLER